MQKVYSRSITTPSLVPSPSFLALECAGGKKYGLVHTVCASLESRLSKGGGGREKRAWYPAIAHALECART